MATVTKYIGKSGKQTFRVQIRLKGGNPLSKSFRRLTDAREWAAKTEAAIRQRVYFPEKEATRRTLSEAIERYKTIPDVKSKTRFRDRVYQLDWWNQELGNMTLASITPSVVIGRRDKLLQGVTVRGKPRSPRTVNGYVGTLSHVYSYACGEWEWAVSNPAKVIKNLQLPRGRDRYLELDERKRLLAACARSRSPHLHLMVLIALMTGMRRGEIARMRWRDIDYERGRLVIPKTKNGDKRSVYLSSEILDHLRLKQSTAPAYTNLVFPPVKGNGFYDLKRSWDCALRRAGIRDFRFHDLRHTCASYMAMNGATALEISAVLGHRTLDMVKRYSHLSEQHGINAQKKMNSEMFSEAGRA